jgi:hypothetical protein
MEGAAWARRLVAPGAFGPDPSPMCLHNALGDREAQARTRALEGRIVGAVQQRILRTIELFEYQRLLLRIDPDALVCNKNLDISPPTRQPRTGEPGDRYLAAVGRELDGILHQTAKHLIQARRIGLDRRP